jgi:PKD repeat protein
VAPGYIGESVNLYSSSVGYGWQNTSGLTAVNRNTSDPLTTALIKGNDGTFLVDVPNGTYDISPLLGDASSTTQPMSIFINGTQKAGGLSLPKDRFANPTYTVTVSNGQLQFHVTTYHYGYFAIDALVVAPHAPLKASAGPAETGNEGSAITFAGSASGGQGILTYMWNFGDGSTTTGTLTPSHTYAGDGTYTASLTVTDALGQRTNSSTSVTINNVAPTVNIGGPYSGTTAAAINFSGSGKVPDTADTLSYSWNFGDGTTSTLQNPSHSYATAGTYTAKLTVTDSENASTTATTTVTVTTPVPVGDYIVTPWDKIPNFGAHPTITSVHSGSWSNPSTWSLGRLPTDGDVVDITAGTTVAYDVNSATRITTVEVMAGGELDFATNVTTKLMVANFLVLQGGTLTIGTAANPVAPNVQAEVIFLNQPLDTTLDPQQYGDGLIGLGNVSIYGAAMPETFIRLAVEPKAGDTTLTLSQAAMGWKVGDKLILPDTRQLLGSETGTNYVSEIETPIISAISSDGLALTLSAPLAFNHLGARDLNGQLDFLPQVADLSHNVIIQSESPTGVRGQVMFTYRANVSVENAAFADLGRTTNAAFDNTTFASDGSVSHLGTNEAGRYSVQFLHLMGPANPAPGSYQYLFAGNSIY